MNEGLISIGVALLSFLGGGGGVLAYMQYRKETPIRQKDADMAAARTSQEMALASAQAHYESSTFYQSQVKELRDTVNGESQARRDLEARMSRMEEHTRTQDVKIRRLTEAVELFSTAWDYLTENWAHLRKREAPPPKPQYDI